MKKYRKWYILFLLLITVMISVVLFNRSRKPTETVSEQLVLRLAGAYPKDHPSAAAAQKFAELAFQETNGRINIKVYYHGELGDENEVLTQMQFGGIAMACVNFLEVSNIVTTLQDYIEPFAYESEEAFLEALYDNGNELSLKMQLEKFIPLVYYYPDLRCFYNNKSLIEHSDDFTELKLKTSSSRKMMDIIQAMGASPVNILTENTFKSLSAGYMDGGETSFCEFELSDYASVIPYVSLSDYLYCPDMIIASSVSLRDISRADQELLEKCAKDTFEFHKELLLQMQQGSLDRLWEKNISIQKRSLLEPVIKAALSKAGGNHDD